MKTIKIISNTLLTLLILFVLVLTVPRLFGFKLFSVLTSSMSPAYPPGSLIYVIEAPFEDIEVEDAITFKSRGSVITHRVVEKFDADQSFTTKGDANESADGTRINHSDVIGRVVFGIPVFGYIAGFFATFTGKIIIICILAAMLALSFFIDHKRLSDNNQGTPDENQETSHEDITDADSENSQSNSNTLPEEENNKKKD